MSLADLRVDVMVLHSSLGRKMALRMGHCLTRGQWMDLRKVEHSNLACQKEKMMALN